MGGKVKILIPKIFLRLSTSFKIIFRQEILTALWWKALRGEVTEANFTTSACLFTFYWQNYFLPSASDTRFMFSFHKCRMSREFCRQWTRSWHKNHTMQVLSPSEGSLFEIVVACGAIIDSSSNPACPKNPKCHKNMNHKTHKTKNQIPDTLIQK